MPLFTDGNISSVSDLRAYDTSVVDVATTEGVALSAKISLGETEIGLELTEFLDKRIGGGREEIFQPAWNLTHVVATPALKQWHTLRTLALIYGDVYNSQLNDRFEGKWKEYQERSRWAADLLWRTGVGLVYTPIAKAKAPLISAAPGAISGATYHVQVAWRNQAGKSGAPNEPSIYTTGLAERLVVQGVDPPPNAVSYDIFVGLSATEITKQNAVPVGLDQVWSMPDTGLVFGERSGSGQTPDWFVRANRVLQRG